MSRASPKSMPAPRSTRSRTPSGSATTLPARHSTPSSNIQAAGTTLGPTSTVCVRPDMRARASRRGMVLLVRVTPVMNR